MYLSKKEAAEHLGVSQRAIERYAQQGKISVKYIEGKNGKEAKYLIEELELLKSDKNTEIHRPTIEPPTTLDSKNQENCQGLSEVVEGLPSIAELTNQERVIQAFETIASSLNNQKSTINVCDKLVLTLNEAQLLTGFSKETLRAAIKEGELKAKIIGRGWRIKRSDLDKYIEDL
jgi:excisionase family DNA binding protein